MSWYKSIMSLYILTFTLLYFAVWAALSNAALALNPDFKVFLIGLGASLLLQYFGSRKSSKGIIFGVPFVLAGVLLWGIYRNSGGLLNLIFVGGTLLIFARIGEDSVNYNEFKRHVRNGIYGLAGLGILLLKTTPDTTSMVLRLYVLFLASSIWLLRDSRRFTYNLSAVGSLVKDAGTLLAVLLLSWSKIFNLVLFLLKEAWSMIEAVLIKLLELIFIIIEKPLNAFFTWILGILSKRPRNAIQIKNQGDLQDQMEKLDEQIKSKFPPALTLILELALLALIIYIIYKTIKNYKYASDKGRDVIADEREKIKREPAAKKRPAASALRKLFFERDFKSQVLRLYQGFERKTYEKNIYKEHMTATQLSNVTSAEVKDAQPVRSVTVIYNEAKFSEHEVSEQQVKQAREDYRNIKKQL